MTKKWKKRTVRLFSRHPSHDCLRRSIYVPVLACIRFGSTTDWTRSEYEINTTEAVRNSSNKFKMKTCFEHLDVNTAKWYSSPDQITEEDSFPILAKKIYGSRGQGMIKFNNYNELYEWALDENNKPQRYIFEKYYNYSREYRIHIDAEGYFYACRKMLKSDTPTENRWFRNDSNCVWYIEENEKFDKPVNWEEITEECVKALDAVGLDIGACDVRVQSSTDAEGNLREKPKFIIVEINSAPSFGAITEQKYRERIPLTLENKYSI